MRASRITILLRKQFFTCSLGVKKNIAERELRLLIYSIVEQSDELGLIIDCSNAFFL